MTCVDQRSARYSRHPRFPAGVSLVELVTSMGIMSVLIGAMGSAVFLATKALPDPKSPTFTLLDSGIVVNDIAQDLRFAVAFIQRLPNLVEFTVADRDNDLAPETILYQWSGTPGDPLTYQYNGGTVVNVIDSVEQFALVYNLKIIPDPNAVPPKIEGPEEMLSSYDATEDWTEMNSTDWYGQYFQPTLPPDAIRWRVTRVFVNASSKGAKNAVVKVQLRPADVNNLPTSTVLEETLFYESSLDTQNTWNEFSFSTVADLTPGDGLCLVLEWVSDGTLDIYHNDIMDDTTPDGLLTTTDSGANWSHHTSRALLHYVYGHVTADDPNWIPPTINTLRSVTIDLQIGTDPRTAIELETAILNQPVVP